MGKKSKKGKQPSTGGVQDLSTQIENLMKLVKTAAPSNEIFQAEIDKQLAAMSRMKAHIGDSRSRSPQVLQINDDDAEQKEVPKNLWKRYGTMTGGSHTAKDNKWYCSKQLHTKIIKANDHAHQLRIKQRCWLLSDKAETAVPDQMLTYEYQGQQEAMEIGENATLLDKLKDWFLKDRKETWTKLWQWKTHQKSNTQIYQGAAPGRGILKPFAYLQAVESIKTHRVLLKDNRMALAVVVRAYGRVNQQTKLHKVDSKFKVSQLPFTPREWQYVSHENPKRQKEKKVPDNKDSKEKSSNKKVKQPVGSSSNQVRQPKDQKSNKKNKPKNNKYREKNPSQPKGGGPSGKQRTQASSKKANVLNK